MGNEDILAFLSALKDRLRVRHGFKVEVRIGFRSGEGFRSGI